jgi:hypothetical protein
LNLTGATTSFDSADMPAVMDSDSFTSTDASEFSAVGTAPAAYESSLFSATHDVSSIGLAEFPSIASSTFTIDSIAVSSSASVGFGQTMVLITADDPTPSSRFRDLFRPAIADPAIRSFATPIGHRLSTEHPTAASTPAVATSAAWRTDAPRLATSSDYGTLQSIGWRRLRKAEPATNVKSTVADDEL